MTVRFFTLSFTSGLLLLGSVPLSFAQTPDAAKAGVVEHAVLPVDDVFYVSQIPLIETARVVPDDGTATKVSIKSFNLTGNTLLPSPDLEHVTRPFKDHDLTFDQLKLVCANIQKQYQRKGYILVRVYLPPQEIKDGIVEIRIAEGKLGTIEVRGNKRVPTSFVQTRLGQNPHGRYPDLLRGLTLLNEYPEMDVKGTLAKGQVPGTTDLTVDVKERKRYSLKGFYNNGGSRFVSPNISGPSLELYDSLRPGDLTVARGFFGAPAKNLNVGSLFYQLPVNRYDTKAHVAYAQSKFRARRAIADLGIRGETESYTFGLTHPVIRNSSSRLDVRTSFDAKDIRNYTLDNQASSDRLRILNFGFDYAHQDQWQGRTVVRNTASIGIPGIFGGADGIDPDVGRNGAGGEFFKYVVDVSRVQKIQYDATLILRGVGQLASRVLPASEEFYLGGIDTVRGYPQAEYLGDQGYLTSVELRLPPYGVTEQQVPFLNKTWRQLVQVALFIDHGGATRKSHEPGEFKDRSLTGVGFGLRFQLFEETTIDMDWGFPVGGNDTSDNSDATFYIKVNVKFL